MTESTQNVNPVSHLEGVLQSHLGIDVLNDPILRESFEKRKNETVRLIWLRLAFEIKRWNDVDPTRGERNKMNFLREDIENNFDNYEANIEKIQKERFKVFKDIVFTDLSESYYGLKYVGVTPAEARAYYLAYSKTADGTKLNGWHQQLVIELNQSASRVITQYGVWYMCYFYIYYHYQKLYNQLHASQIINSFQRGDLISRVDSFKKKIWNGTSNVIKSVPELEYCAYDVALSVSYDDNLKILGKLVGESQIIFTLNWNEKTEGDVVFETDGNFIRRNLYVTHQNLSGCKECLELALLRIQDENGQFREDN